MSEAAASLEKGVLIIHMPRIAPESHDIPLRLPRSDDGGGLMFEDRFTDTSRFGDADFNVEQSVIANPSSFREVAFINLRNLATQSLPRADSPLSTRPSLRVVLDRHGALQKCVVRVIQSAGPSSACRFQEHVSELDWTLAQQLNHREVYAYCVDGDPYRIRLVTPKDSLLHPDIFQPQIRGDCLLTLENLKRGHGEPGLPTGRTS